MFKLNKKEFINLKNWHKIEKLKTLCKQFKKTHTKRQIEHFANSSNIWIIQIFQ